MLLSSSQKLVKTYRYNTKDYSSNRSILSTMNATEEEEAKIMGLVQAISIRLDTGLPPTALQAILDLLRQGVHPDAVVAVIETLRAS